MKALLITLSGIGLALTVVPSFLVFYGVLAWEIHARLMLAGMLLWFGTAPFWVKTRRDADLP